MGGQLRTGAIAKCPERGSGPGLIFAGYVPLASYNPYPIIVYSVAKYRLLSQIYTYIYLYKYRPLSHFWENVIFVIPT